MRRSLAIVLGFAAVSMVAGACSGTSGSNNNGGNGGAGNAAAAGGTAGTGGGINTDSGTGGGGGFGAACAADIHDGELVPVDMFVMLDRSGSMDDAGKWSAVSGAFTNFVQLPNLAKLGMGLAFFPTKPAQPPPSQPCVDDTECGAYGPCIPFPFPPPIGCGGNNCCSSQAAPDDSCVAPDYAKPVVPIADLPGVGSQITAAIGKESPGGASTPMSPALEGAIDYAQGWAQQHTDHVTVVVLATDGEPNNCNPNRIETVAARAEEGLAQNPSIKTFVIGVGSELTTLNLIAQKGGTDKAIIVTTGNAAQEFLDALDTIRGSLTCQYQVPVPKTGEPDPNKVNVGYTPRAVSKRCSRRSMAPAPAWVRRAGTTTPTRRRSSCVPPRATWWRTRAEAPSRLRWAVRPS